MDSSNRSQLIDLLVSISRQHQAEFTVSMERPNKCIIETEAPMEVMATIGKFVMSSYGATLQNNGGNTFEFESGLVGRGWEHPIYIQPPIHINELQSFEEYINSTGRADT